jgi:hypothetical protein
MLMVADYCKPVQQPEYKIFLKTLIGVYKWENVCNQSTIKALADRVGLLELLTCLLIVFAFIQKAKSMYNLDPKT